MRCFSHVNCPFIRVYFYHGRALNEYLREKWHTFFCASSKRNICGRQIATHAMKYAKKSQTNVMHRVFTLNFFFFFSFFFSSFSHACDLILLYFYIFNGKKKRLNHICAVVSLRCLLSGVRMIIIRIKITFK